MDFDIKDDFDDEVGEETEDYTDEFDAILFDNEDEEKPEEQSQDDTFHDNSNKATKKFTNMVIIGAAILCGIIVFITVYIVFNPRKPKEVNKKLSIESKEVQQLYSMVTYGMTGVRYEKYIKEPVVELEDFTNYDKYYYALSYANINDFQEGETSSQNVKNYTLSADKIDQFMRNYFGDEVTYDRKTTINYSFPKIENSNNKGTLMYDSNTKKYNIVFTSKVNKIQQSLSAKKYFSELVSATQVTEDEIELKEYIIYSKCSENQSKTFSCVLYKDYENSIKITERPSVSYETVINFEEYPKHSTIIYRFKKNSEGNYSFKSSKIEYTE